MSSRRTIKIKKILKQNWIAFTIVILWFLGNYIFFAVVTNPVEGALIIFYFTPHDSLYGNFYSSFTEFIIFGLLISLITIELFRKYNPVDTSRELSKGYSDHVIIIGYTHIGKRLSDYFTENNVDHVIIEDNYELIEDLIAKEEPVINDSPLSTETLEDAGIENAKAVYIMSDSFETQLVASAHIRDYNKTCALYCRLYQDDIADVIGKTYNAKVISTSKYAANVILNKIRRNNYRNILIIGVNHITHRLVRKLNPLDYIKFRVVEKDEIILSDLNIDARLKLCGDACEEDFLKQIGVEEMDCVINVDPNVKSSILISKNIRDLNRKCKIISRFFLESVAEILEAHPFNAEVISSSNDTLQIMKKNGMLDV